MKEVIKFHKLRDPHGHMSNFYQSEINLKAHGLFKTSEHLYQSIKFLHLPARFKEIQNSPGAWAAAKLGRDPMFPIRSDWETVKLDAMRYTVMEKYRQNKMIANLLLKTGDAILVEYAPHGDYFWGDGGDGTGENWLGIILQEVRFFLREDFSFFLDSHGSNEPSPSEEYLLDAGAKCGML